MANQKLNDNANALYEALKRVRQSEDSEYGDDGINKDPLWMCFGFESPPKREHIKAALVKLVREKANNDLDADILLMSFGLLKGYEDAQNIGSRRRLCLEHSSYFKNEKPKAHTVYINSNDEGERKKLMKMAVDRLLKKEDRLLEKLALSVDWIQDKPAYFKDIREYLSEKSGPAIIPAPRSSLKMIEAESQPIAAEEVARFGFINPPYTRNHYFTSRDESLAKIHANFHDINKPCEFLTLSGLGGAGKTQIALEYAYSRPEYDITVWVDSESRESIFVSIHRFVSYMNLGTDKNNSHEIFLNWFQNHNNWLLIYDNVDDYAIIEPFLPKREGAGYILMTSRLSKPYKHGEIIYLDVLDEPAAVQFLEKRTGIEADSYTAQIANSLGFLPLALEQAGAYIAENNDVSYAEYLNMLEHYDLELMEEHDGIIDYEKPLTATWNISIEKIEMKSAKQLLCICSYFAPNNILVDGFLFPAAYNILPEPLQSDVQNDLRRKKIVRELTKYSLCSSFVDDVIGEQLSMHHLVQQYIRRCLGNDTSYISLCCYVIDAIYKIRLDKKRGDSQSALYHAFYIMHGGYAAHVEAIDRYAQCLLGKNNKPLARLASLQYHLGIFFTTKLNSEMTISSYELFNRSIYLVKKIYGDKHANLINIYRALARAKEFAGDTAEALQYNELADSIECGSDK